LVTGLAAKSALLDRVRDANGEGVVFVRLDAEFVSGKGRSKLKFKFVESATCIVIGRNVQRSVEVGLLDEDGDLVSVGNVTIPENADIPVLDSLIEVRYLYRFSEGALEQPVFLSVRHDLDRCEALLSQVSRIKNKTLVEA
jgi:bifunctional non-homologous end joining protein LigD